MFTVKITDPESKLFGKTLSVEMIYLDYKHTGDSPNIIYAKDDEGTTHIFLSTEIDEADLKQQKIQKITEELGAQEGDKVLIISTGSYYTIRHFDFSVPHTITSIFPTGHVEFDDGAASCFRPIIKKIRLVGCIGNKGMKSRGMGGVVRHSKYGMCGHCIFKDAKSTEENNVCGIGNFNKIIKVYNVF